MSAGLSVEVKAKYHHVTTEYRGSFSWYLPWRTIGGTAQHYFLTLYITLVQSHLEYANSVWNPQSEKFVKDLERVHMRTTKIIIVTLRV